MTTAEFTQQCLFSKMENASRSSYVEDWLSSNATQRQVSESEGTLDETWLQIKPFEPDLLPVPDFSCDLLPNKIYEYVKQHAERLDNAPIEYAAIAVVTCAAALIGNSVKIQPKKNDYSWTVPCVLWALAVGQPAQMKTPSLKAGESLIEHVQKAVIDDKNRMLKLKHQLVMMTSTTKVDQLKRQAIEAYESGDEELALKLLTESETLLIDTPAERHVKITDFTKASLANRLLGNPNGLLLFRDEMSGFFAVLNSPGGDEMRSFLLECYDASGTYVIDRVKFGKIVLKNSNLSLLGGIQPSLLLPILSERNSGTKDDGAFERLGASVMPDHSGKYSDIKPDAELIMAMKRVFEKLSTLADMEAQVLLKFDSDAQELWTDWAVRLKQRTLGASEQEQSIFGKQASLCARLALVLHVLNCAIEQQDKDEMLLEVSSVVPQSTLEMAIKLTKLLEAHSRRIQAYFQSDQRKSATILLIERLSAFDAPFSLRELIRKGWKGLTTADACKVAIEELVTRNYLKQINITNDTGRTVQRYAINPILNQT